MTAAPDALPTTQPAPWTEADLTAVRERLLADVARLTVELDVVGRELSAVAADATSSSLHDEIDLASSRLDMLQDAAQAENAAAILAQTQHVVDRLDAGLYGVCESCSGEIVRARLEAFPRATLCVGCVG